MSKTILIIVLLVLAAAVSAQTPPTIDSFIADDLSIAEGGTVFVNEGDTTEWLINASDIDSDPLEIFLYPLVDIPDSTYDGYATFTDSGGGVATYYFTPLYYHHGLLDFVLLVTDGVDTTELEFTLDVVDIDVPPIWDPIADDTTTENLELTFEITASDLDDKPVGAPNHKPVLSLAEEPVGAYIVDEGDGRGNFFWTPNFAQSGDHDILFLATDSAGNVDTQSVQIHVIEFGNQDPSFVNFPNDTTIVERAYFKATIMASDPEEGPVVLSATNLPANATFAGNSDSTGLFSFRPDETQYPASYTITFEVTDDSAKTITEDWIIDVSGPNDTVAISFNQSSTTIMSVTEGDSISIHMAAVDDETDSLIITAGSIPVNAFFIDHNDDPNDNSAELVYTPSFIQAPGLDIVYFFADDGAYIDTLILTLTTLEAGNQAPELSLADSSFTIFENDILEFTVSASDPDTNTVTLNALTTEYIPNLSFDRNTGIFTFQPDLTQGGSYDIMFTASDSVSTYDSIAPDTFLVDTIIVPIEVTEVDFPPTIGTLSDQTVYEGEYLRFTVIGSDVEQIPTVTIESDPDDSLDPSFYSFIDNGDGTGQFEMYADFAMVDSIMVDTTMVEGTSRLLHFTFTVADSVDAATQDVVVTVMNVGKDANDLSEADSLLLSSTYWDGGDDGFSVTAQIWNDDTLCAAGTGFGWDSPWIKCDSILLELPVRPSGDFSTIEIYNDSLQIYVGFILFDSTMVDPGGYSDYFTAYFSFDSSIVADTMIDIDTLWESGDFATLSKTDVGSAGGFAFDRRLRGPLSPKQVDDFLASDAESEFTYQPLVNDALVRAAFNSVILSVFDIMADAYLQDGDTIIVDGTNRAYQLVVQIENPEVLSGVELGLEISSPDDASWLYQAQPGGLGVATEAVTILDGRMSDHINIWDASGGLQVTETDVDGLAADSLILSGLASSVDVAGMAAGTTERVMALNFIPGGVGLGEVKHICIDTATIGAMSGWGLYSDTLLSTAINTEICFPIKTLGATDVDDDNQLPSTYNLDQNYPNPFNPTTTIKFSIAQRGHVSLRVINILGQSVRVLTDQEYDAGTHEVVWDGKDRSGNPAASGIYLYLFESEKLTEAKKMILLK